MQSDFLTQFVKGVLPAKRKSASKGWVTFNAPCCQHNGESADTRGRGGIIFNPDGAVSYHCFNCQYKTSWQPGRPLSYKFRKLLSWLGASENDIRHLVIEAIRVKDFLAITNPTVVAEIEPISYKPRPLPAEARSFNELSVFYTLADSTPTCPKEFLEAISYVYSRRIDMDRYEFYWTPEVEHKLSHRVIVPFKWQNQVIGYSSRAFVEGIKPKFYTQHEPDFVFNTDMQNPVNKFVVVVEGLFDAMSIDGVAVCSNECSERQADIIDGIGKEVIVVPDFDVKIDERTGQKRWPGARLIEQAVEFGWSVSFPVWAEDCKDVSEAVQKYGKLFVLKTIIDSKEHSRLKIELKKRKIFNG
jgi:hypothetical protein